MCYLKQFLCVFFCEEMFCSMKIDKAKKSSKKGLQSFFKNLLVLKNIVEWHWARVHIMVILSGTCVTYLWKKINRQLRSKSRLIHKLCFHVTCLRTLVSCKWETWKSLEFSRKPPTTHYGGRAQCLHCYCAFQSLINIELYFTIDLVQSTSYWINYKPFFSQFLAKPINTNVNIGT